MSDMMMIMKLLGSLKGSGPIGTAAEPWNPASKFGASTATLPQTPQRPQAVGGQVQTGGFGTDAPIMTNLPGQGPQSFGQQIGNAVIPNTMQAMQGKGGASG